MTNKTINIILGIVMFLLLGISFWIGRISVKCPEIIKTQIKTDTLILHDTINKERIVSISKPYNVIINKDVIKYKTNDIYHTDTLYRDYPTFLSIDTLRYKNIYVSINDTGSCDGIYSRHYIFGGDIENKVITKTITNTITRNIPLISLYGGFSSIFDKSWKYKDVGPYLQLSIKERYNIGYNYMLNSQDNILHLTIKLK